MKTQKLTKEEEVVCIDIRNATGEQLADLYDFLIDCMEKVERDRASFIKYNTYLSNYINYNYLSLSKSNIWCGFDDNIAKHKTSLTIKQFKQMMTENKYKEHNINEQIQYHKDEIQKLEQLIKEHNEPKEGDICKFWDNNNDNSELLKTDDNKHLYNESRTKHIAYYAEDLILEVFKSFDLGALELDERLKEELASDIIETLAENGYFNS